MTVGTTKNMYVNGVLVWREYRHPRYLGMFIREEMARDGKTVKGRETGRKRGDEKVDFGGQWEGIKDYRQSGKIEYTEDE